MKAIFISYRRDDSEGQAGRLYSSLTTYFNDDAVFMDVAGIEAGRDFREAIDQHVTSCAVLLAVIGKRWLEAKDEAGQRRIDDPTDFVRLETASALKRGIPVVPVLVQGARMVKATDLPPELHDLAFRNAIELTHAKWDSDVEVLVAALRPHLEDASERSAEATSALGFGSTPGPAEPPRRRLGRAGRAESASAGKPWGVMIGAVLLVLAIGVAGYVVFLRPPDAVKVAQDEAAIQQAKAAQAEAEAKRAKAEAEKAEAEADTARARLAAKEAEARAATVVSTAAQAAANTASAVGANAPAADQRELQAAAERLAASQAQAQREAEVKARELEAARLAAEEATRIAQVKVEAEQKAANLARRATDLARVAIQAAGAVGGGPVAAAAPRVAPGAAARNQLTVNGWRLYSGGCGAGQTQVTGPIRFTIDKTTDGIVVTEEFTGRSDNGFEVVVRGRATFAAARPSYDLPTEGRWSHPDGKAFRSEGLDRVYASDALTPTRASNLATRSICRGPK